MKNLPALIGAAIITTILFATVYVIAQQVVRLGANDEPSRLASQVASELRANRTTAVDGLARVDIRDSAAVWVVVRNLETGETTGSGYDGATRAELPKGVLIEAQRTGEDDITWAPTPARRYATVSIPVGSRIVTAGQSLGAAERHIGTIGTVTLAGWLAAMVALAATTGAVGILGRLGARRPDRAGRAA